MKSLAEYLKEADKKGTAIGHFNFAEISVLRSIVNVAKKNKVPIIAGTSEGERDFFDQKWAVNLVRHIREKEGLPIFINADHTRDFKKIKEAVAAGYDAIIFDAAHLPLWENIKQTKKAVEYIKSKNPEILVEGEIGYIGASSQILNKLPKGAAVSEEQLTTVEEARQFVQETKVDLLAPAIGSVHGIIKTFKPKLSAKRVKEITQGLKLAGLAVPLVLHGASGSSDQDVRAVVKAGINLVHFSTEIRVVWRRGLEMTLKKDKNELAPYKLLIEAQMAAEKLIEEKVGLFGAKKN